MNLKTTIAGIVLAGGVAFSAQAEEMPGKGVSVQAIQSPIAEETFQTMLLNQALKDLGYEVKPIQEVDYSAGYTSVANGDATYMAVNWYPLHETMYKNAGGDDKFYRKGKYIDGAAQGYLIDKKTAEKHGITNIGQFTDPKIAKIFDTDGDGKADLTGCQAGWGCEGVIEHQLDAFKLRDSVEHRQGAYAAIISDTIQRYKDGDPIFYYTWTPYWVSGILVPGKDVVWLEVPFSSNPNDADTEMPSGKNYGFEINSERVVANKQWAKDNPAAAKLFEIAKLSVNDVSAQNMKVRDGEDSQEQIMSHTKAWIKANKDTYDGWLKEARDAAE
ncbi:glycine betaine/L-proline ABC transporter substrate-binding protein ProX [Allohahella marinimesophila]|uniref:Glycine betaine/L-proline ABC transporter substrate-binding protein ProX n=1 Tax=Allohahella marinimesophila TaxID=1054972 RepID=A0ABP7PM96_9GAMM